MYEGGNITGDLVAVNLGITGVTSPGWATGLYPFLKGLEPVLNGTNGVYELMNRMNEGQNPGNVHGDLQYKGFYAVKATKVRSVQEKDSQCLVLPYLNLTVAKHRALL